MRASIGRLSSEGLRRCSALLFAGHEEDGFVIETGGTKGGFDGDLLAHVYVFGTGFNAEFAVFPDAEFDAGAKPCTTEAVALAVLREHVCDEEFDAEEVVKFAVGEGGEAVVFVLCLLQEDHVAVLARGDGDDDVVSLACLPCVDLLVAAAEFGDFVDDHPGNGFGAFGDKVGGDNLVGVFRGVDGFRGGAVVSGVVDAKDASADAVRLGSDAVGTIGGLGDSEDYFIVHAAEGIALLAHDFRRTKVEGVHFELVVFGEGNGVVELARFDVAFPEVHFGPFDFEQAPGVFLHAGLPMEGKLDGFAPAVGMRGDEGSDEGCVLLDECIPLALLADTEHFGDVCGHFHSVAMKTGSQKNVDA